MATDYYDFIDLVKTSECCGASIIFEDICSDCKEHCSIVEENDEN